MSKSGLTRRELGLPLLAAPLAAQQASPAPGPEAELAAAREQQKRTSQQLRSAEVPTLLEPSFVFRP